MHLQATQAQSHAVGGDPEHSSTEDGAGEEMGGLPGRAARLPLAHETGNLEEPSTKCEAGGQLNPHPDHYAARLPPAPRLLYGLSPLVVPRPGYWPPAVQLCGFWQPPPGLLDPPGAAPDCCAPPARPAAGGSLHAATPEGGRAASRGAAAARQDAGPGAAAEPLLQWRRELLPLWPLAGGSGQDPGQPAGGPCFASDVVHAAAASRPGGRQAPVCFDFGSMAALGLLGDVARAVAAVRGALGALGMRGVLLTGATPKPEPAAPQAAERFCVAGHST